MILDYLGGPEMQWRDKCSCKRDGEEEMQTRRREGLKTA